MQAEVGPVDAAAVAHCPRCREESFPWHRIVAPYRYQWPVDRLISALKYHEKRHLTPLFGALLAREVSVTRDQPSRLPSVLLPVPLHPHRWRERGFNQAADIASWCARHLDLQCRPGWARRVEDTGSLASSGRAERELMIRGAFTVDPTVEGRHLAIVDDVMTTGATAAELARECLDSGASSVELWVVARTVARIANG